MSSLRSFATAGLAGLLCAAAPAAPLPLTHVADIPLPGPANRLDYQAIDGRAQRLYIAHLGAGTVAVVDLQTHRVLADIPEVASAHGVLAVPELGRVYASATGTRELVAIDAQSLKVVARAPAGRYPDGVAYASRQQKLYVSDEIGRAEAVIDVKTHKALASIEIGGEAGNSQYDPVSGHIFVNEQSHNVLVEIDPASDRVLAKHPLPGARGAHGLLIDAERRIAYVACEGNARLLVFDLKSLKVAASFEVGDRPDVLAYDPGYRLLYVASESGVVSMFSATAAGLRELGRAKLAARAHTVAVDPATHRVYFPLEDEGGMPVLRIMQPTVSNTP